MSTKWLAIQSFQYDRSLIAAINTLSIQIKLELAGISDSKRVKSAEEACSTLYSFLDKLEVLIDNLEQANTNPLTGTTQSLRQLAQKFSSAKNNKTEFHSILFQETVSKTKGLLNSELKADKEALLLCLQELRKLIEEHIYLDTNTI